MQANNEYPVLDGIAPSWADVVLKIAAPGAPTLDMKYFKSINTGRSLEIGDQMAGGRVMNRTTGEAKQEASCVLYREGHLILLEMLVKVAESLGYVRGNQVLVGLVHFGINYALTPPGSKRIYERRIKGCRMSSDAMNGAQGSEAASVDVGLNTIQIADVIGGKEVVLL